MVSPSSAFQAVLEMPFEDADVFAERRPVVVPACTLLSQIWCRPRLDFIVPAREHVRG